MYVDQVVKDQQSYLLTQYLYIQRIKMHCISTIYILIHRIDLTELSRKYNGRHTNYFIHAVQISYILIQLEDLIYIKREETDYGALVTIATSILPITKYMNNSFLRQKVVNMATELLTKDIVHVNPQRKILQGLTKTIGGLPLIHDGASNHFLSYFNPKSLLPDEAAYIEVLQEYIDSFLKMDSNIALLITAFDLEHHDDIIVKFGKVDALFNLLAKAASMDHNAEIVSFLFGILYKLDIGKTFTTILNNITEVCLYVLLTVGKCKGNQL